VSAIARDAFRWGGCACRTFAKGSMNFASVTEVLDGAFGTSQDARDVMCKQNIFKIVGAERITGQCVTV